MTTDNKYGNISHPIMEDDMIKVSEQTELTPTFDIKRIYDHLQSWEKENPNRWAVASALEEIFKHFRVYVGGCHVAVHSNATGNRILMITGDNGDWI